MPVYHIQAWGWRLSDAASRTSNKRRSIPNCVSIVVGYQRAPQPISGAGRARIDFAGAEPQSFFAALLGLQKKAAWYAHGIPVRETTPPVGGGRSGSGGGGGEGGVREADR